MTEEDSPNNNLMEKRILTKFSLLYFLFGCIGFFTTLYIVNGEFDVPLPAIGFGVLSGLISSLVTTFLNNRIPRFVKYGISLILGVFFFGLIAIVGILLFFG